MRGRALNKEWHLYGSEAMKQQQQVEMHTPQMKRK